MFMVDSSTIKKRARRLPSEIGMKGFRKMNSFTLKNGTEVQFVSDDALYASHEVEAYAHFADAYENFFASRKVVDFDCKFARLIESIRYAGRALVKAGKDEHSFINYGDAAYDRMHNKAHEDCEKLTEIARQRGFDLPSINGCYTFAAECDHHGLENLPFADAIAYATARRDATGNDWYTALAEAPAPSLLTRIINWFRSAK